LPPELALVQDSSLGAFDEVVAMLRGSGSSLSHHWTATPPPPLPQACRMTPPPPPPLRRPTHSKSSRSISIREIR